MQKVLQRLKKFFQARQCDITVFSDDNRKRKLTSARGTHVTFLSDGPENVDDRIILRVSIYHKRFTQPQEYAVKLLVTGCREVEPGKRWECSGDMTGAPEHLVYLLERTFEPDAPPEADPGPEVLNLRGSDRRTRVFQVLSPDRRFKAVALDLSTTGVRLQVNQPLDVGTTLKLIMDFDVQDTPPVDVQAKVVWCTADEWGDTHQVGLRFLEPPDSKVRFIHRYLAFLQAAEHGIKEGRLHVQSAMDTPF